jgi:hypothetical protein
MPLRVSIAMLGLCASDSTAVAPVCPRLHSERAVNNLGIIQQFKTPLTLYAPHHLLNFEHGTIAGNLK